MSLRKYLIVKASLLLAALLLAPLAQAETPACDTILTNNTKLDADMTCPGTALRLEGRGSKNVVLNCAGHSIATSTASAIVAIGVSGITIKNCEISTGADLAHAILFEHTKKSTIKNNLIDTVGSHARGIELRRSSENTVSGNTVHTTGSAGSNAIRIRGDSNDNLVQNNKLQANDSYPVIIESSQNNRIHDNTLVSPQGYLSLHSLDLQAGGLGIDSSGNIYAVENEFGSRNGIGEFTTFFQVDPGTGQQVWASLLIQLMLPVNIDFGFDALDITTGGNALMLPECCPQTPVIYELDWLLKAVEPVPLNIVSGSGQMNGLESTSDTSLLATSATGELFAIDLTSGDVTLIGQQAIGWTDLAVHPTDGKAYAVSRREDQASYTAHLYEIDPATGAIVIEIGDTGEAILSDIDFAPDGTLYGNNGSLITIDTTNATVSQVGSDGFGLDRNEYWPRLNRLKGNLFQTVDGSLRFLDGIVLPTAEETEISTTLVEIGPNKVMIDSAILPFLDEPARITLENIPGAYRNLLVDPEDEGSFVPCDAPQCKFVSFLDGALVFDVNGFTTYSSEENTDPSLEFATTVTRAQIKTLKLHRGISKRTKRKLRAAEKAIVEALNFIRKGNISKALKELGNAASSLAKVEKKLASAGDLVDSLVEPVKAEAQAAIDLAIARAGVTRFVTDAQAHMASAQLLLDADKPDKAIPVYRSAWISARKGFGHAVGGTLEGLTGGSILLQQNGGDDLLLSADGAFSFDTMLVSGSDYQVTILNQPNTPHHDCKVKKGKGSIAGGGITNVMVKCTIVPSLFAYVANAYAESVTTFSMNPGNGALTELFPAQTMDWGAHSVAVDPTGRFVYKANYFSDTGTVDSHRIDQKTGAVTGTGSVIVGLGPYAVTVDPSGRFAYVAPGGPNQVTVYAINQSSGLLTYVSTLPPKGHGSRSIAIDPGGRFAYMAGNACCNQDVLTYSINQVSGMLTEVGTGTGAGDYAFSIGIHPSGRFAYVVNIWSSDVNTYSIDPLTGALTELGVAVEAGDGSRTIALDPSGRFAYVGNQSSNDITIFDVDPVTGALTQTGSEFAVGLTPTSIAIDPSGRFALVTNAYHSDNGVIPADYDVIAYAIDRNTGALTMLDTYNAISAFDPTGEFQYIHPNAQSIELSPPKRYAYVANGDSNDVSVYGIDPGDGMLTALGTSPTGTGPLSITVDPGGRFAYAANVLDDTVTTFAIHPQSGALSEVGAAAATGLDPLSVTVDPTGRFAYVANVSSNDITSFAIDGDDGTLTEIGSEVAAGDAPNSVVVEPSGRFAYVANVLSNDVTSFGIDAASGALTEIGTEVAAGTSPRAVTVHPSGRFAYVVNQASHDVTSFGIDLASGVLTEVGTEVAAGDTPKAMTIHPNGLFAYVANEVSDDITTFSIDPASGALTEVGTEVQAGDAPRAISVDSTGRFAYVANFDSNDVTRFSIDPLSGVLTEQGTEIAAGTGPHSIAIIGGSH